MRRAIKFFTVSYRYLPLERVVQQKLVGFGRIQSDAYDTRRKGKKHRTLNIEHRTLNKESEAGNLRAVFDHSFHLFWLSLMFRF